MDLLTPGVGLIFWQIVIFTMLFFVLKKFAWKPITESLKEREKFIEDSLDSAKKAKEELINIQKNNQDLILETRREREKILVEAKNVSNIMQDDAKIKAKEMADKIVEDAKKVIDTEKNKAMNDVKNTLAELSIDIAEKIIRKDLSNDSSQKKYVDTLIKEINKSK